MIFLIKEDKQYKSYTDEEIKELCEAFDITSFGFGVLATKVVDKLKKKVDDSFKKSGLRINDTVKMIEIDPFKRRKEFKGKIVLKGHVPYVNITSGPRNVGQIVRWTPNWVLV